MSAEQELRQAQEREPFAGARLAAIEVVNALDQCLSLADFVEKVSGCNA
jgi:hypothetical protein